MDRELVLETIPDKECAAFLEHPEETADKVQQRVSSDSIPTGPEAYKEAYKHLIKKDKKLSLHYLATCKMHTTTWHK